MLNIKQVSYCLIAIIFLTYNLYPQSTPKTINQFTQNMTPQNGFFKYYLDNHHGRIYLEITRFNTEFLYQIGLAQGIGSNDIGLDRSQLGSNHLVRFEKTGNRVLLHQINTKFRAKSKNPSERRAVHDSFASSVLWGFTITAQTNNTTLIDLTPFLLNDQFGITQKLNRQDQGEFQLDKNRSALYLPRTKNFPHNTEYETTLTFKGKKTGPLLRQVTPTPESLTIRQHISFIRLPDTRYTPRAYNINSGYYATSYFDFAAPIDKPLKKRFIQRHRLRKKNPGTTPCEPVKPIIYYVDPGAPEPIRNALIEGAQWWDKAFEAAGYKNAFQVKLLPQNADPMDVRYNVINWVHRSTRGWSYGSTITDPRTGEIIKGHVALGSLRIRQDVLIAQGILTPYTGDDDNKNVSTMKQMALTRIRQLSAHEVGHTLGLTHNYASSRDNRSSVMDYPHPLIRLTENNRLDFSRVYTEGIGEWDKVAIGYGYSEVPTGQDEKVYLQSIIDDAFANGLTFISDPDSRGTGNLHAYSHLWDNGKDPLAEFTRLRRLRRYALDKFSVHAIPLGEPISSLEEVLVPLYYAHRYQVEAVGKMIGGMTYAYTVRRERPETSYTLIAPRLQEKAVDILLGTLSPKFLVLPETVLSLIPPKALGYDRGEESFPHHTGRSFDALAMTEASASFTMEILLHPQRAARLVEFRARDVRFPGFVGLLDRISGFTVKAVQVRGIAGAIRRRVNHVYLHHLMLLALDRGASEAVRGLAMFHLAGLKFWLEVQSRGRLGDKGYKAHYYYEAWRIGEFLNGRYVPKPEELKKMPPGSPI